MTARKPRLKHGMTPEQFAYAKAHARPGSSDLEVAMWARLQVADVPPFVQEYKAIPGRAFPSDFAWPEHKVALEIDGAIWVQGRHSRGTGITTDCEKQNWLASLGWRTLRVTDKQIVSGWAVKWLKMTLNIAAAENTSLAREALEALAQEGEE